jgi:CBS domain-containing protein
MTPAESVRTVSPGTSVADLVERMFEERHTGYPVVENGRVAGIVTLSDAEEVREVERDAYRVEEIMSTDLESIAPDDDAMEAFSRMQAGDIGRLVVLEDADERGTDGGELAGLVTRSDLMTALDIIRSSGSLRPGSGHSETTPGADSPAAERR